MSIYDEDWGTVQHKSFVPAIKDSIQHIASPLVESMPTNGAVDGGALRAMESGEKSTPVDRGIGAAITLVAFLVAGIVVAFLLIEIAKAGGGWGIFAFLVCALFGGYLTYLQVTTYSPAGVELDKSARYENIRLAEIEANERITVKKLEAYLSVLQWVYRRED